MTWLGETFAGRAAASLLTAVGLPELIAPNAQSYVEQAIALAGDPHRRAALRSYLEGPGRASALFDTAATARAIEQAYLSMAEQYRQGTRFAFRGCEGNMKPSNTAGNFCPRPQSNREINC